MRHTLSPSRLEPVAKTERSAAHSGWDRSRFSRLSLCNKDMQPFVRRHAPGLPPLFQIVGIRLAGRAGNARPAENDELIRIWKRRRVCKPSSVPGKPGDGHLSGHAVARMSQATYPRTSGLGDTIPIEDNWVMSPPRDRASPVLMLVLHQAGFFRPSCRHAGQCALAALFHPYRVRARGGMVSVTLSVHGPSPSRSLALNECLALGARTFLPVRGDRPTRLRLQF